MRTSERCTLSCSVCGRRCNGTVFGRQTHRFDCCGVIRAHVPRADGATWFASGMEAGYLTGLSRTQPKSSEPPLGAARPTGSTA